MSRLLRGRLPALAPLFLALAAALLGCRPPATTAPGAAEGYLFCFWNTENFFDDELNGWKNRPDEEFDTWFAKNPGVFKRKLENLTTVLAGLNDGRGPDVVALAEVETQRAAELLMKSLNDRIGDKAPPYESLLMKDPHGGRHIATAILTRLKVDRGKTRLLGRRLRILEGHVEANGHDLVVLATHWTSRVSDKDGEHRAKYADEVYGRFKAMALANPKVDLLVCGDFNDNPDDPSVTRHLHAVADAARVRDSMGGRDPLLLNLFAGPWEKSDHKAGTHNYRGKWMWFDQVAVSPGLLDDQGWSCDPESARVVKEMADRRGRPLRFGTPGEKVPLGERGASDHFPVTVRLKVAGAG